MSDNLPQVPQEPSLPPQPYGAWAEPSAVDLFGGEESEGISWRRYLNALARQKWLVGLMLLLGATAAGAIWIFVQPEYQAQATLWIDREDPNAVGQGPIRSGELLSQYAWVDLIKSPPILAPIVRSEKLFIVPENLADSVALADFDIADQLTPGEFRIAVDPAGERFTLATNQGEVVDEGSVGDSVGRGLGFLWAPGPSVLSPGRTIDFTVVGPAVAALQLAQDLQPSLPQPGTFLTLSLRGEDPVRIARVVNGVAEEHVRVAGELKRKRADDLSAALLQQRDRVYQDLQSADLSYEQYRVETITLPSDRTITIAPGLQATSNSVMGDFFSRQLRLDQLQQDQARIQQALRERGDARVQALELVPSVQNSRQMMSALGEYTTQTSALRTLLYRYTEEDPRVVELKGDIDELESAVIPRYAQTILDGLSQEESLASSDIERASEDLRAIPQRTVAEDRLKRDRDAAAQLYSNISSRYETARLAAASTVPDVRIWSEAAVPQFPIPDERLRLMLIVLGGSLALGILGALVLDRIDPRVQYPEEVTSEMGLTILGAVPPIKRLGGRQREENTEHVVEAFRELRLNLLYAYGSAGPGPILVTVTSPGSGDGKSLITANLGVAFAELGRKTLIVDGDTRRGDLHQLLGRPRKPGLTDYLAGEVSRSEIIQKTDYESLDLISSGARLTHAPELLGSIEMRDLFADLRTQYGVILVDSPPLGAGSDAFMLGTLTGSLIMVLRTGTTNKELTMARLAPLGRLPIRIVGAILNDVQPEGVYRYYSSYLPGYGTSDEERELESSRAALQGASDG